MKLRIQNSVKSQNARSAVLTTIKTAKNKIDELVAWDRLEEINVLKLKLTTTLNASTIIIVKKKPDESKKIAKELTFTGSKKNSVYG